MRARRWDQLSYAGELRQQATGPVLDRHRRSRRPGCQATPARSPSLAPSWPPSQPDCGKLRPVGRRGQDEEGPVTPEQAREFVANNHRAVMITRRSAGGLQTSPVTVGINSDGEVVISSRETAYKVRNLRRHPTATLCVLHRQLLRPLDPDRRHHPDRALAAGHGRADRLLPPHLRRASRLGRLPARHGRPAACAHPADHRQRRPYPRRVAATARPATWKQKDGIANATPRIHRRFGKIRAAPGVRKRIQERPPGPPRTPLSFPDHRGRNAGIFGRTSEVPPRSPTTTQRPLIAVCLAHQAARCNGTTTFTVYS